ncbi:hypothetical protein ABI59_02815 [Acidobacteria bacterium Mor1]|nr:hypothetical protein ABI59_02815 [Acidobacteria bacterium Mor1]
MPGKGGGASAERLDKLLVDRGLVETRTKAQALILAGKVRSGDRRLDKPGTRLPLDIPLTVEEPPRYVGRGGHKLAYALSRIPLELEGRLAMDVGASTGGFTQVLLEHGAAEVLAVDVGRGQLDWSLRSDSRVKPIEGINARYLTPDVLPGIPSLAVVDVSFISLRLVLPAVAACLAPQGEIVALVKPQFEVDRAQVGRKGIVRDPALHRRVLVGLGNFAAEQGWSVGHVLPSGLRGAQGNQEFFLHIRLPSNRLSPGGLQEFDLEAAVDRALRDAADEEAASS